MSVSGGSAQARPRQRLARSLRVEWRRQQHARRQHSRARNVDAERLTLKELHATFDALREENFDLRLRVNHLEERARALSGELPPDVDSGA